MPLHNPIWYVYRDPGDHFFSQLWWQPPTLILGRREVIEPHLVRYNLYTVKDPSESKS